MSIPTSISVRWGIAAGAAAILFAILFVSFNVFGQTHPCDTTDVVPDQTNTGLIADCKVLWGLKDTLRGTAPLNWNETTAITGWSGAFTFGTPARVTGLLFNGTNTLTVGPNLSQTLNGTLPPELENMSALTVLRINDNSLTGSIPPELGNMSTSTLATLNLAGNSLTGSIPPELGNLSALTALRLSGNSLTGSIPRELGQLSNLVTLGLNNNSLSGPIPSELGNLSNLSQLYLQWNSLSGPIPSELGNLSNLLSLQLAHNRLSGEFPRWIKNLTMINWITIQRNLLTGPIPWENPLPASIARLYIGRDEGNPSATPPVLSADPPETNMWIGCLPPWTRETVRGGTDTGGRVWGELHLINAGLPECGSPPGESIWVLDTVLEPPSPVRGEFGMSSTSTKMTLRATYTIPAEYVTSTTTPGLLQFRSLTPGPPDAQTAGTITVTVGLPGTTSTPMFAGFDGRSGSPTGVPDPSDLTPSTTIASSDFASGFNCNTVGTTESMGVYTPDADPIAVVCQFMVPDGIWVLDDAPGESPYVINVGLGTTAVQVTLTLRANGINNRYVPRAFASNALNWAATELVAQAPFTPTPTPTATPTVTPTPTDTPTHTPVPPTSTPTPTATPVPPTATPTVEPPTATPAAPTSTPTPTSGESPTPSPGTDPTPTRTPLTVPPVPPVPTRTPTPDPGSVSPPPPPPGTVDTPTAQATAQATAPPTATPTPQATRPPSAGSYDIVATRTPTATPPPTMTPTRTPVPTSTATSIPTPVPPDELPRTGGPGISGGLLLMLALAGGLLLAAGSVILRARTARETP